MSCRSRRNSPTPPSRRTGRPPARPTDARLARRILSRLVRSYGPRPWKRHGSAVELLVWTILSQSTSDVNSEAGFRALRRALPTWDAVADAPAAEIARAIRRSGLARQKAPRIRRILRRLRDERGRISLEFLRTWDAPDAYEYLVAFDGVGPKTALCVMLFALDMPVFPVDTHVHRIATRLGLLPRGVSPGRAHEVLAPLIPPPDRYAMHVLLIEHGRRTCRAQRPRCPGCRLRDLCPHGRRRA